MSLEIINSLYIQLVILMCLYLILLGTYIFLPGHSYKPINLPVCNLYVCLHCTSRNVKSLLLITAVYYSVLLFRIPSMILICSKKCMPLSSGYKSYKLLSIKFYDSFPLLLSPTLSPPTHPLL